MTFGSAVSAGFRNYAVFSGRASRSEFWWFMLFLSVVSALAGFVDEAFFWFEPTTFLGPVGIAFSVATLIPAVSVTTRRLHDVGRSGWWQLLLLVPIIGWAVIIYWNVKRGDTGRNAFGSDPRA